MLNQKLILTYEMDKRQARQLEALAKEASIRLKPVTPSQYMQTLGFLCGITGMKRTAAAGTYPAFEEPMVVFSGIDNDSLDVFLDRCRQEGCLSDCLKAILTPVNVFWNSVQLYEELQKERAALQRG